MSDGAQGGGQGERTALAWNRTALAILGVAAAITRVTFERFGVPSLACLGLTLPLALWIFWTTSTRFRQPRTLKVAVSQPHGAVNASLAAMIVILGLAEVTALLSA